MIMIKTITITILIMIVTITCKQRIILVSLRTKLRQEGTLLRSARILKKSC